MTYIYIHIQYTQVIQVIQSVQMLFWSPSQSSLEEYIPKGGWNPIFSNQDKIKYTALYLHFKKKGYTAECSEIMTQMILFKEKYKGLTYSKDQERVLSKALLTGK